MKKYLLIALAALGFAACAENQDDINNPTIGGEVEESYIAINLMSADLETRALEGDTFGYEDGTDAERAINSAHFFFFDEDGNPFNVTGAPATAPGGGVNHLSLAIEETTGKVDPNISDIKKAVLVLNTYKGVYPSQIVAVLNWTPDANTAYTLTDLHGVVENSLGNDTNGYVMSNSVYMDKAGNMIDAVPLTAANIKTTSTDALDNPVEIYVERTAAKVTLTASGKVTGTTNIFDTQKNSTPVVVLGSASEIDVYVQIHGWELYNDYQTSSLLKNIDTAWDDTALGLTWNDLPYYRCYWAESQSVDPADSFSWEYADYGAKGFPTEYGYNVAEVAKNYVSGTYAYCGENTNGENYRTKVILKGQLMQKDGENNYKPLELANWYGTEYAGNEALRIAVANSLKYTLYYKYTEAGVEKYISIDPDDLECIEGTKVGKKAYEVGFQLSTAGQAKEWYLYSSAGGYQLLGDASATNVAATNAHLATVEPALLYTEGQTYYIVDIKHLGKKDKTAEYGVVRNHVYQINIESIKGYGSPVYSGSSNLEDPEYPTVDEGSYVAARINVLSWKVVKQGVQIGQ